MPRPTLKDEADYLTLTEVANELSLSPGQVLRRIEQGILSQPTLVKDGGLRLFSKEWLIEAQKGGKND